MHKWMCVEFMDWSFRSSI